MKPQNLALTSIVVGALAVLAACATPKPPQELVEARGAYAHAQATALNASPTELREARQALDDAEAAFTADPDAPGVRDRAYIALRKAELASAKARTYVENQRLDANTSRLRDL